MKITKKGAKCSKTKRAKTIVKGLRAEKYKLYLGNPREELLGLLLFLSASEGGGDCLVVDLTED
jgi:hypothetical protein